MGILLARAPHSGATGKHHPPLLATPAGVELARKRVAGEPWAKPVMAELLASAEALGKLKLPVFDTGWWHAARTRPWREIYPEVNAHTGWGVAEPMVRTRDAAMAYALTGKPEYAASVRKVLMHYTNYQFFAKHPDTGLNWAGWCLPSLQAYGLIQETVSEADRRKIDAFFERAVRAVLDSDRDWLREGWGGRFNNHYAHHKRFIGTYGLFYGRRDLVEYALDSEQGYRDLIEGATRDGGLWHESSLNYHSTGVEPAAGFATALANAGYPLDLWNREFANGRKVRDCFTAALWTLFPDGTLPTIGDTYGIRAPLGDGAAYFEAYNASPDPLLGWMLRNSRRPPEVLFLKNLPHGHYPAPAMRTRLWPEHGYAALRTQEGSGYWNGDGYSAFLTFDADGIHSHGDKLSLMVFARGAHIAIDTNAVASAPHAFSARIQNELNRHTVSHNTLMVDGQAHRRVPEKLSLIDFIDGGGVKLATAADEKGLAYPGVRLMRTVAATPDYVLDVFQAASAREHTYDYLFHTYDDNGTLDAGDGFQPVELGKTPPWSWLRNGRQRVMDTDWQAAARQGTVKTRFFMAGEPGTRVTLCGFPQDDAFAKPLVPAILARRQGKSAVFVAVIQAERGGLPGARASVRQDRFGTLRIAVESRGTVRDFRVRMLQ